MFYHRFAFRGLLSEKGEDFSAGIAAMRAEFGRHHELHEVVDRALFFRLGNGDIAKFMRTGDETYLDAGFVTEQIFTSLIREAVVRKDMNDFSSYMLRT